ncbi:MAG: hypothetical protein WA609_12260 [Terriglobales bacterium]
MPITFGTGLACFLAHTNGAQTEILRSSTFPESKTLILLGGGLVLLASLVRRLYPMGGIAAPKSMQVILWISPKEVVEHLDAREN